MLLPDTDLVGLKHIQLQIINADGRTFAINVDTSCKVDNLKVKAVANFLSSCDDCRKESLYYKLINVKRNKQLCEDETLSNQQLSNDDEILLLKKRIDIPEFQDPQKKADKLKAPTADDIRAATSDILPKNITGEETKPTKEEDDAAKAYSGEACRKILVSLLESAQRLHYMNPALARAFSTPIPDETPKSKEPKLVCSDVALRQLVGMGFAEHIAKIALHKNNNEVSAAIQWLLDNDSTSLDDIGVEATEELCSESSSANENAGTASPSNVALETPPSANQKEEPKVSTNQKEETNDSTNHNPELAEARASLIKEDSTLYQSELNSLPTSQKVKVLLKSFKQFARSECNADPLVVRQLEAMGFTEGDVLDALRITDNNQQRACDFLLKGAHLQVEEEGAFEGMDTSSALYQAIMESENVQLGLQNPLCVIALLMMLESSLAADRWLKNDDIGVMLITIAKLYEQHKETHGARVT